jgi:endogenous inhibitor of DNA gyrase (YacG/DUF329 family)
MPDERPGSLCVFCRRQPVDAQWRPFCSERCKLQDLARWAGGNYRVPVEQTDEHRDDVLPDGENLELRTKKDSDTN